MLAKAKEKDVIDQLLDQIDFHGMTAEELAGESGLLKKLRSRFYSSGGFNTPPLWGETRGIKSDCNTL